MIPNPPSITDIIQAIASILAIVISIVSLIISHKGDRKTKELEIEIAKNNLEIAKANLRPILTIETDDFTNSRGVLLVNHGTGRAIITNITISKGGTFAENNKIADLMYQKDRYFTFDYFSFFTPNEEQYVEADRKLYLVQLTEEHLRSQNLDEGQIKKILDNWYNELSGIQIEIKYQDMIKTPQPDCVRQFR